MKKLINFFLLVVISYLLLRSDLFSGLNGELLFSYNPFQICAIVFSCFLAQYLMYIRWLRFLRKLGVEARHELVRMWHHRSILIGYFIFGFVTSDVLRVYNARSSQGAGDIGARLLFSSQATILDRLFSLASLVVVASLAIPIAWLAIGSTSTGIILLSGLIFFVMCLYQGAKYFKSRNKDVYIFNLIKLIKDHLNNRQNNIFMLTQFLISLSANITMGFAFFIICKSEYSLMPYSISVLSLSNLTAIIPLTPAGLGFAEGLSEYLLTAKGLLLGAEAVFILRVVNLLVTLTYWLLAMFTMEKDI